MSRALERYAAKRRFARTPEPPAAPVTGRDGPLLFAVQKHAARRLHYDFRLELDGVLKSWAVPKGPSLDPHERRLAVQVEDHPFDYASFEGVIPQKEYGAGRVIVWDCGVYSPGEPEQPPPATRAEAEARARASLAQGKLSFFLRGEKLKGSFALVRTATATQWLLLKHADRFVGGHELLAQSASVLSGETLESLANAATGTSMARLPAARLIPEGSPEKLPERLLPMLAEAGGEARSDPRFLYEPKLDGYRTLAWVQPPRVRLLSRRGQDLSVCFPEIVEALAGQGAAMILDGEIVALGPDGRPSFNALQNRAQLKAAAEIAEARARSPAVLVCFDLLHFDGRNLRGAAYADRRRYLSQCLLASEHLQRVHASADAEELYRAALESGFEGIVAKRRDGIYQPGKRSAAWQKVKATRTIDLVVGGYTRGKGAREALGALLLGYWRGKALQYAGHVGSGLSDAGVRDLLERLRALERDRCPFRERPPLHRPTHWLQPRLVVEVSYADWTPDGLLRAPVLLRLREDLDARRIDTRQGPPRRADDSAPRPVNGSVVVSRPAAVSGSGAVSGSVASALHADLRAQIDAVLEQLRQPASRLDLHVGSARIRLTHLDRIYWPADPGAGYAAVDKRALLRYLAGVAPFMLPHLADRPLTMIRMPEGIEGERFFQKHWEATLPDFVETLTVYSEHRSESGTYLLANNLPTLLWLGQNGTLEFHVWHSRAAAGADALSHGTDYASSLAALEQSVLNYPDYLVFDIDPYIYSGKEPKGAEPELNTRGFAGGKQVALWLRKLLAEMSLQAIVKTSGKTGLHVFVPIERTVTFDEARHLCETVGRYLLAAHPREITMEWAVEKRTGKIFIDYNMNVRGKTLNAAYSPRGVPGAPISLPLSWEELEAAEPLDFRITNILARLEKTGDRWHDALLAKQSLAKALGPARAD